MKLSRVYYFQRQSDRAIKIGRTTNVRRRREELEVRNGPLTVLATHHGGDADERKLHRRFEHLRIQREWFRPGDELLGHIADVTNGTYQLPEPTPWPPPRALPRRRPTPRALWRQALAERPQEAPARYRELMEHHGWPEVLANWSDTPPRQPIYTAEFQASAVEMVETTGRSVHSVAAELRISDTTLSAWMGRGVRARDQGRNQ